MGHQSMMPGGSRDGSPGGRSSGGNGHRHQPMWGRGSASRKDPRNDGNLYTSRSRPRKTDVFGNRRGSAAPSAGIGCCLALLLSLAAVLGALR